MIPGANTVAHTLEARIRERTTELENVLETLSAHVSPMLRGDPGRLRQVLLNLATNACKFTDQGRVEIRVDTARETDSLIRFEVKDTGIGIPAEHRDTIFDAFSQVDMSITRRHGGTGLGLPICKRLVEAMGGEIGFDSDEGKGSTFWFTVRLETSPPVEGTSVDQKDGSGQRESPAPGRVQTP